MFKYVLFLLLTTLSIISPAQAEMNWDNALTGDHRAEGNADRNAARHPPGDTGIFRPPTWHDGA